MISADNLPARSFNDELNEITGDVLEDYSDTIHDTSSEAFQTVHALVVDAMTTGKPPAEIVSDLATMMLWHVFLGREHALRGFPDPVGRKDADINELVPDEALRNFMDGEDGQ